jgi:hypothetical protein
MNPEFSEDRGMSEIRKKMIGFLSELPCVLPDSESKKDPEISA